MVCVNSLRKAVVGVFQVNLTNEAVLFVDGPLSVHYDEAELFLEPFIFGNDAWRKCPVAIARILESRYVLPSFIKLDLAGRRNTGSASVHRRTKIEDKVWPSHTGIQFFAPVAIHSAGDIAC